jgi:hypothetical protein
MSANPEVQKLCATIINMDALSQEGFSEIASIASLALLGLEAPGGRRHIDDVINALKAIRGKAYDIKDCIDNEAENVGCKYVDKVYCRRLIAELEAQHELVRT